MRTYERLFASVDSHMSLEVKIKREPLVTEITFIWFFTCVNKHVSLEFRVVKKSLAAAFIRALEKFVAVDSIVLLKRSPVMEYFTT